MQLILGGQPVDFIPLQQFRAQQQLPAGFGLSLFIVKDWSGCGSLAHAGPALAQLRQALLADLPAGPPPEGWPAFARGLQQQFETELAAVNACIGLREPELAYAAVGFATVCQLFVQAALRAQRAQRAAQPLPAFDSVYAGWLARSARLIPPSYRYLHRDETWRVTVVEHIYGRVGLLVETPHGLYAVQDPSLACPAEAFMEGLLRAVTAGLANGLAQPAARSFVRSSRRVELPIDPISPRAPR